MPTTNRPFFANFLAAFRAHSALTKASSSTATSNVTTQSSTSSAFTSAAAQLNAPASARTIATKSTAASNAASTTAAVQAANSTFSPTRHPSTSPHAHTSAVGRQAAGQSPASPTRSGWARRRGSDSSNDSAGFREALGAEKWYIGGRTATGEERFLRLGMVHRERSWERRSADQMSL